MQAADYRDLTISGTGSHGGPEADRSIDYPFERNLTKVEVTHRTINYPFERYLIKVEVTSGNEFVGIREVEVNKEFLSYEQGLSAQGSVDVNADYPE